MRIQKEYQPLAKAARSQGWEITRTKGGHLRWVSPKGCSVYSPATPSDWRGLHNVIRKLRHEGLEV